MFQLHAEERELIPEKRLVIEPMHKVHFRFRINKNVFQKSQTIKKIGKRVMITFEDKEDFDSIFYSKCQRIKLKMAN